MSRTLPANFVCVNRGRHRPACEEDVVGDVPELHAKGLHCRTCASVTFVQPVQTDAEDAAETPSPLSPLPEGESTGQATAGSPRVPASPAVAPVTTAVRNCEDCGSGWQADYAGAPWGWCFVISMRTPARGAGCENHWTAKKAEL